MFDMPSKIKIKADIQSLKYELNLTGLRAVYSESFFKSADTSLFLHFVDNSTLRYTAESQWEGWVPQDIQELPLSEVSS